MPNGHDKNWVRLCGAINGFRARYDRWPTRVRLFPACLADIRHLFAPADFEQITAKLALIADDAPIIAEDDTGASYNYGRDGFPDQYPTPSAEEWLSVYPRAEEE